MLISFSLNKFTFQFVLMLVRLLEKESGVNFVLLLYQSVIVEMHNQPNRLFTFFLFPTSPREQFRLDSISPQARFTGSLVSGSINEDRAKFTDPCVTDRP